MRISKSSLIRSGVISFILIILVATGTIFLLQKEYPQKIDCISKTRLYFYKKCGYFSSTSDNKFHKIVGVIHSKESDGDNKIINLITHNSSGSSLLIPIYIYPDPIPKNLTTITPDNELKNSSIAATTKTVNNSETLLESLNVNEEIIVNIFLPDKNDVTQAQTTYGDLKALKCGKYQELTLKFLSNSSLINNLHLQIYKLISGCNLYTLQVEKIKR